MNAKLLPCGLGRDVLMSYAAPAFKNKLTSLNVIFPAVVKILKHIIKINVILSFSNRPLFIYRYTCLVKNLIIISTLFEGD
jgi:hypothetical protein